MEVPLDTNWILESFHKEYDLKIGGKIFNSTNLEILEDVEQFNKIPNKYGCYFIFSKLPETEIFTFNNYNCFKSSILKNKNKFGCIYNGKAKNLKTRIKNHLYHKNTKTKIINGEVDKISLTGCLSLESIKKSEIKRLFKKGKLSKEPNYDYLKHSRKLSIENRKFIDQDSYLLNGINIFENKWSKGSFGLIILTTESSLGASMIEEAFRQKNGIPPLCKK